MFARTLTRTLVLAAAALLLWSVLARPSGAHGPRVVYHVRASDTLWSIAEEHLGGDPRAGVWQIEQANHLNGAAIYPGETLILP